MGSEMKLSIGDMIRSDVAEKRRGLGFCLLGPRIAAHDDFGPELHRPLLGGSEANVPLPADLKLGLLPRRGVTESKIVRAATTGTALEDEAGDSRVVPVGLGLAGLAL